MKIPRDLSAADLISALAKLGYEVTRQRGSHLRLTTQQHGEHHLTIPNHDPLRVGVLARIVADVSEHFAISRDELLQILFG